MVIRRALAERRPWLLASLLFGISYFFVRDSAIPGAYLILWKGAGVGFLAFYALRRHDGFDARLLAAVMVAGSLGDMILEFDFITGALAFMLGHVLAIWLYARNRRRKGPSFSQRAFAFLLVPATVFIAWALPFDRAEAPGIALYSLFLAVMAAMAWTSRFPRYRVGAGALMFLVSDLMIFARLGPLEESIVPDLTIWSLYYVGQFLICTGVIQTLYKDER